MATPSTSPIESSSPGCCRLRVKAVPNTSRSAVDGLLGDRLKVALRCPPQSGRANAELCRLLASALGLRSGDVRVLAGFSQPRKTVEIRGIDGPGALGALGLGDPA